MSELKQNKTNMASTSTMQIVVFKLGQEEYGLRIDQIKEVVITPTITKVPQIAAYIKGVANIRGNVIAMLDLEERFGLTRSMEALGKGNNFTLVIESEEYKMGILVREVPNTLSVSSGAIADSLFTGDHQAEQSYVDGIINLDKRLIIMIDIFKVITEPVTHAQFLKNSDGQVVEA